MTKLLMKLRNRKGFTLIELIVVIAILGILAAVLIPQFTGFQDRATRTQVVTDAKQIATAIDSLRAEGPVTAVSTGTNSKDDPVIKMSGVAVTRITSLTYGADGTFVLTSTVTNQDGKAFIATRAVDSTSGELEVVITNAT